MDFILPLIAFDSAPSKSKCIIPIGLFIVLTTKLSNVLQFIFVLYIGFKNIFTILSYNGILSSSV